MTPTDSRHEGDSWDLASSVGATATAVAASRATASKGPDALLDDPWADPLVRAVGLDTFVKVIDGELDAADDPLLNRRAMNEQIAVRTRYFDDFFVSAAASGIRQAVILASGLDTRAYRLPWPTGTVVYEIDQPEVIEFKTRTLSDLGAEPTAERRTVAIDLRDDWPAALRAAGFDPAAPTAWSAEGLLVYLPPEAQDRLFDNITELSTPGSQVATEHMDMRGLSENWAEKLTERTKRMGSGINLADLFYLGERHSAADYLASHGWRNAIRTTADAYGANGFELPNDELAGFGGDSGYLTATRT
ncbi:putative S-adenosyl-L-methionine-dependent methyltransferase [Mycobacterium antarcticum]|uniref:class I SAM-dependent methyltransferase n=1 Tax=unclassified Mycolicibacterium TaxID=2636767 RepID=UPI00239E7C1E|nr:MULTISPECIES: class I SAM-dependent methyltransferase [unclassified Mycolicibacterium]BDX34116.1 putative S-adenosyl-L-methionine-dependent methyltransferase [Mycolicibacterium sp. TUM20985]GLP77302.1 putative S-adenosyl-L-methionine-dependent methyltransferase [Mycolicibacterium sp. TUM20983]GLP82277.1 putative S-adenosyl-L-methionine-dependent methyltransferase [Mycolicibacterium sp. TUM20984]